MKDQLLRSLLTVCLLQLLLGTPEATAGPPSKESSAAETASVPGVLLVQLTESALRSFRPELGASGRTGLPELDARLGALGATEVAPLFDGSADLEAHRRAGLDRILRIRFSHDLSAQAAAEQVMGEELVYAEPDLLVRASTITPNDPLFGSQWAHRNTGSFGWTFDADTDTDHGWTLETGSSSLTLAILDTGVDLGHPEWSGRVVAGFDFINNDANPTDDNAHGTSCAGIALAAGDNGQGIAGVAWNAKLMPIKVLAANGEGPHSAVAQGITFAADNGARILSLSLGSSSGTTTLMNAVNYAYTTKGCLLFCATGNDDSSDLDYPAAYTNAISVGAMSPCAERKNHQSCDNENWWGSNYGTGIDFLAPGVKIVTTDIQGEAGYTSGDYYTAFNGTSSATPHAAGIGALLWSEDLSQTNAEVWSFLQSTCEDLGAPGFDLETGYGRINAANALEGGFFIDATHGPLGHTGSGRGVAWGDYDQDGDPDLYLTNDGGESNQLFRNDDGLFSDATQGPLGGSSSSRGVGWGDYDNDGDLDLFIGNDGPDQLLRNDGAGIFIDATSGPLADLANTMGISWADYDLDGDLDLYLCNYESQNKLLRNDGGGTFTDVTVSPPGYTGFSRNASWGDYDQDGIQDLYLNTEGPNRLFHNNGDGTFSGATSGPLIDQGIGRGCAWGDYDRDLDLDLYIANDGANHLLRNDSGGLFTDATAGAEGDSGSSAAAAWGDYDNDGDLDLYLTNDGQSNKLLRNEDGLSFSSVTLSGPLANSGNGQGAAWADYDRDGDLDLYVANSGQANLLLRNDWPSENHWLHVTLRGTTSNRAGIGARVRVVAGGISQIREISGGANYLSQDEPVAHFGLGLATTVDSLIIWWPSGGEQVLLGLVADQFALVSEGGAASSPEIDASAKISSLAQNSPNPFRNHTLIAYGLARAGEIAIRIHSADGRIVRTLVREGARPGTHRTLWNGRDDRGRPVASGIYYYTLTTPTEVRSKKMLLLE